MTGVAGAGDDRVMDDRTQAFMNTHARLLDRRRYELFAAGTAAARDGVRAALAAYLIPGGGYGAGLEPDLRSGTAQPVAGLHAFEVFEELAPHPVPEAAALCDWLGAITLPDGGLPFALPVPDAAGVAPFFAGADPEASSPHMTAMLAGCAHRLAGHDPAVRDHPWLATATAYAMDRVGAMTGAGHALEYRFALQFLDAAHDRVPDAAEQLRRIGAFLPASGVLPVEGGIEGEAMRPLDFAPVPDRPLRGLFPPEAVAAELAALAAGRDEDGGWDVDWAAFSPAAALEWRGWATVRAVGILRANGRG